MAGVKGRSGGRRPNQTGRPSAFTEEERKAIFSSNDEKIAHDCLVNAAKNGNTKAAEIIMAYRKGKPAQTMALTVTDKKLIVDDEDGEA
jgi:hypothetical protein